MKLSFKEKCGLARKNADCYLFVLPYMLIFFVFTVLPVLLSMLISFTDFNMIKFPNFVGADNYVRMLFKDDLFMTALKNTLIFALVTGPISYLMCFGFAWLINENSPKMRAV